MRFELVAIVVLGCSLNTDRIRERDGSIDASTDASADAAVDAPESDAPVDSATDSAIDAPELDVGIDVCSGSETCDGVDQDCDGRLDEDATDCSGSCVDAICEDSGNVLWYATIGSTVTTGTARDRVFGLAATDTTVFAAGDAQGDELSWTRTVTLRGGDGFLLGLNAAGGTSLATMSSGGGDVARDVVFDGDELHVVGVVTGTATFGEGMISTAGTTGFMASYSPDAEVASDVERLGQTTALEAVVLTDRGRVAVGPISGRLEHVGCGSVDAAGRGIAWAPDRWCTVLGNAGDQVFPHDVAAGPSDAIYVVGTASGTATIGDVTIEAGSGTGAFVAKLDDADGEIVWVRSIESSSGTGRIGGNAVVVLADGSVVIGGQVDSAAQIAAGGVSLGTISALDDDPYLVAFDDAGGLAWTLVDAESFSGGVLSLALDRDALFVGGWHGGVSFGCTDPIESVAGNGEDAFVVRLDADTRACRWVSGIGSAMRDRVHALAVDPVRDVVYIGGELSTGAVIRGETIVTVGDGTDGFVVAHAR